MWFVAYIVIGAIASWLAGQFMRGTGFGLLGDAIVGAIGAFIGTYVFRAAGAEFGAGVVGGLIVALASALLLLFIIRLITRRRPARAGRSPY